MNKIKIAWNPQTKGKERLILFGIGFFMFVFCSYRFVNSINQMNNFEEYITLAAYLPFVLIGFLLMTIIFDWNNIKVKFILCGILGAFLMLVVLKREAQIGLILFATSVASLIIYKMLENILVTITTFFLSALICLPVLFMILGLIINNGILVVYIALTVYVFIYKIIGLKVNKWVLNHFIKTCEHEYYNAKHFKNLLSLIYITIFFGLNLGVYAYGLDDVWFNLINNAFLTAITIIQLNWKNIFIFTNNVEQQGGGHHL